ncbi:MAG: tetratricopeptide repeat protein [Prevotella sp.]|nr:tetratricopeptide repeat protein [Prevotella sp.]
MTHTSRNNHATTAARLALLLLCFLTLTPLSAKKKQRTMQQAQPVQPVILSENNAKRFNYFFLEAVRQQQQSNYAAAYDLYRHCLDINPSSPEVYSALSDFHSALDDKQGMLDCMRRAAELCPDNDTYLEKLGEAYLRTHDYDSAIEVYEELQLHNPARTDVLNTLVQLYNWRPDYQKAIEALNRMEAIEGSSEDLTFYKMQLYAQLGDKKKEYNELRSLMRQHPYDYNYRVMLGNWLLKNGKKKDALAEYNAVLKKEPSNIMARMSILDYYKAEHLDTLAKEQTIQLLLSPAIEQDSKMLLVKQFVADSEADPSIDSTQVLDIFRKMLALPQPDARMAEINAAYMAMKKMPQDSIDKALEHVLEIEPSNVNARYDLLDAAYRKKDLDRVVMLAKPGTEYNPDNIGFYYFLGVAYYQKDDHDSALETFRKGVGQTGENSNKNIVSDFYSIMGDILHEKGLVEEAFAAYDSCLQWKADNIGCLNNYAYYLSVIDRDLSKAEQMSYRTVKAEPKNSTFLDTYAWILFRQQRYQEAKVYIDQALANDSTVSAVIIEHAGDIYMMAGETEKALDFWKQALQKGEEQNAVLEEKIKMKKYIDNPSNP